VMADGRIAFASLLARFVSSKCVPLPVCNQQKPITTRVSLTTELSGAQLFIILKMLGSWLPAFSDPDGRMFLPGHSWC
jgi:hypothetical protein